MLAKFCFAVAVAALLVPAFNAAAQTRTTTSDITVQGVLHDVAGNPATGERAWRVVFFDAPVDGNQLGTTATGAVALEDCGRFSFPVRTTLPVTQPPTGPDYQPGDVYYELAIDCATPPDGVIDPEDVFPERVRITSVLFSQHAWRSDWAAYTLNADKLDGKDSTFYATDAELADGLADKSDVGHGHQLNKLSGSVTDAQVPDTITIDYAAEAGQAANATTAEEATHADQADFATSATWADDSLLAFGAFYALEAGEALIADEALEADHALDADTATTATHADTATTASVALSAGALLISEDLPTSTSRRLYNNGGNLFWNGVPLNVGDGPLAANGVVPLTGDLDVGGNAITNLGTDLGDDDVADDLTISSAGAVDKGALENSGTLGFDWQDDEVTDDLTLSGGAIDNTPIGQTTAAEGRFTDLLATSVRATTATFGSATVTIDDDIIVGANGRVGIGTASPSQALDVAGGVTATTATFGATAPSGVFFAAAAQTDVVDETGSGTASASSVYMSYGGYLAFDDNFDTYWASAVNDVTGWLQYDFGAGQETIIGYYTITIWWWERGPKDFTFEASNDGSNWTVLDTRTGVSWSQDEKKAFSFANNTPYRYYRFNITALGYGGDMMQIREVELARGDYTAGSINLAGDGGVGVNTTSPEEKLDVAGAMRLRDTSEEPPTTTTERLYNSGGGLFWNGMQIDTTATLKTQLDGTGTLGFDWQDDEVADDLTISSAGAVDKGALENSGTLGFDWQDDEVADDLTLSGGTIDDTPIGQTTPAAGAFTTLNTGQGANELYAMDQDVQTTDDVTFNTVAATTATFGTATITIDDDIIVASGGKIGVGTASPAAAVDIQAGGAAQLDQAQESIAAGTSSELSHWQSFTAGQTGLLSKVSFYVGVNPLSNATVTIFSGEGTSGAQLCSETGISAAVLNWKDVVLSTPVEVSAGSQYTFEVSMATEFSLGLKGGDVYTGGIYGRSPTYDLQFRTYVLGPAPDSLRATSQIVLDSTFPPTDTASRLYNDGGNLFWNGTQLDAGAGLATSAAQYVVVELADGNSDTDNATALQAAYTAAKALNPASDNRVAVIVPPGRYDMDLGTTSALTLDTPYLDLVGLTTDRAAQYIYGESGGSGHGVLMQTADNVRIENLTVACTRSSGGLSNNATDPAAYWPNVLVAEGESGNLYGSSLDTVIRNCEFIADDANARSMRVGTSGDSALVWYAGVYTDVVASDGAGAGGNYAFGGNYGSAAGTFTDCTGGDYAFGGMGEATGLSTFVRCTGGSYAFGGQGTAAGVFTDCTGGPQAFGGQGTASGTFTDCTGGDNAFGGLAGTASGEFTGCNGVNYAFGGNGGTADGTFTDCTGGSGAFGGYGGTASGTFTDCTGDDGAFGGGNAGTASGTFTDCTGSDYSFGGGPNGATASGTFTGCTGGAHAFGGSGGTAGGTFANCTGGNFSFGGQAGTASGTFTDCTGGLQAFGGGITGGTASGTFTNCTGGDYAFGGNGTAAGGKFYFCNGDGANAWAGDEGTKMYCIKSGGAY